MSRYRRILILLLLLLPPLTAWAADPHAGHTTPPAGNAASDFDELKSLNVETMQKEGKIQTLGAGAVQISPERQQMIGVKFGRVERRHLQKSLRTVGRIEYDEKRIGTVSAKIGGWVEELYADFTGRFVAKGSALLTIYSPELVSTQEEYLLALRARDNWQASPFPEVSGSRNLLAEATKRRLKFWDISDAQIEALEKGGPVQKALTLYSPLGGVVLEKMVNRGMYVEPGATLFKIADLSVVWLIADIYEYELPLIRIDQQAVITLPHLAGESFTGKAVYINPALDPRTRTAKVRFEFPNPKGRLKPEMFANVTLKIDLGVKPTVPESAVIDTGTRRVVLVTKGEGYFEPRDVVLGAQADGYYEVLDGLKIGEQVTTSANFLIDSESKLKEAVGGGGRHQH
jgi:Cu(I)/Ag(I) efflux system membrane fusion protein